MTPRHLLEPGRLVGGALLRAQSDARLVDLTRAGNDRAFEAIVARYRGELMRYCSRILADGRADDAVQQVFLNAYNAIHRDTTPLSLRSWLFGIAHNVALNVLRQRYVGHEPLNAHQRVVESVHDTLERRERFREVLAAIGTLPPSQRDALLLRELEGRGHEEIARELGITGGAARQLISRARSGVRRAAAAILPFPLLMRLTDGGVPPPTAARVAELTAAGGGITAAKVVATAAVGGTLLGGAVKAPDFVRDVKKDRRAHAATAGPSKDGHPGTRLAGTEPEGEAPAREDDRDGRAPRDRDGADPHGDGPSQSSRPGSSGHGDAGDRLDDDRDEREHDDEDRSGRSHEDDEDDVLEDRSGPSPDEATDDEGHSESAPGESDDVDPEQDDEPEQDEADEMESDSSGPSSDDD